ncbi:hypothetical protein GCM10010307_68280 [Streptomyces vastus]|uniref:Uncharacterized protein n=2 Tax=Streptomyces vastus TaxID=285451 RepID=A0ABP6E2N3_9ACTN
MRPVSSCGNQVILAAMNGDNARTALYRAVWDSRPVPGPSFGGRWAVGASRCTECIEDDEERFAAGKTPPEGRPRWFLPFAGAYYKFKDLIK